MLVGYARVPTREQNQALQLDALRAAGCERVYTEKASGAQRERPELKAALDYAREGDTLVVWKLDRLARSIRQLIETVEDLEQRKIGLRSLTEAIDTTLGRKAGLPCLCCSARVRALGHPRADDGGPRSSVGEGRKGERERIFLSVCRTVSCESVSTCRSSTILWASRRRLQRPFPSGGAEQARVMRWASCAPSSFVP
jgi:Resolvase, N terminal domain